MLDGKDDHVKTEGWSCIEHWHNMIGKGKKSTKLRKVDSDHEIPLLNSHEPYDVVKNASSHERIRSVHFFSITRFYSELNALLSQ